jgi:signal transduction histidine kinase
MQWSNVESALFSREAPLSRQSELTPLEAICRREIDRAIAQFSLIKIQIVLKLRSNETPQTLEAAREGFNEMLFALSVDRDLHLTLFHRGSVAKLLAVPHSSQQHSDAIYKCNIFHYIFVFSFNNLEDISNCSDREYIGLQTDSPLSLEQQHHLESRFHLLDDCIAFARSRDRQQERIQFLEQVIRQGEHQLRHPLATIALYAETLCLGLSDESLQEQAQVIRQTANDLKANLNRLLECGWHRQSQPVECDLCQLVAQTQNIFQPQLDANRIRLDYPDAPALIHTDRWQMQQVFENLLGNAIAMSPPDSAIACNWHIFNKEILIEISDSGPGLAADELTRIFEPFYSRREGGTGLGLAVVKKIVLALGGSIWAQNLPDGGARFCISLPRNTQQT